MTSVCGIFSMCEKVIKKKINIIFHVYSKDVPMSYVHHTWHNKGYGMSYPVWEMVHLKDTLLLIEKSCPQSHGTGSGFLSSLSE